MNLDEKSINYATKFWGKIAAKEEIIREERFPLVDIQTTIAWILINKYVGSPKINNLLDAGAGIGRYSLPVAKFGLDVTHLDISEEMNKKAKKTAKSEGIKNITFEIGEITNLQSYNDKSYDMTLCLDAPISYSYPDQNKAIKELCRVTKDILFIMVSNRNGLIPFMIDFDLSRDYLPPKSKRRTDPFYITKKIIKHGVEIWPEDIKSYLEKSGKEVPADYSFKVNEITNLIEDEDFEILSVGGPGALARSIKPENLEKIRSDERLFNQFIKLSMSFDFDFNNIGLGAVNLLVIAKRKKNK